MKPTQISRFSLWALILAVCICGNAQKARANDCSPPIGTDKLWATEHLRYLLVGELHGTNETPAMFAEMVCSALMRGKRVLVGLEFPESARDSFRSYILSDDTEESRTAFLRASGWYTNARLSPDGRTSRAMLAMVERLAVLHRSGAPVFVTTFVRPAMLGSTSQTPYEVGLAASLQDAADSGDYDLVMVLVGNIHALTRRDEERDFPTFDPMAMHLPRDFTLALDAVPTDGEAWNCQPDCGPHSIRGGFPGPRGGIVMGSSLPGVPPGYDGVVAVGTVTTSPPVLEQEPR